MSAALRELLSDLDALLDPGAFDDHGPNGLQVPGATEVERVATAVSASAEVFERAAAAGAQLVLVHHGLFWRGMPQAIDAALHRRLAPLFAHDLALAAYHLPLDAHPDVGNNALLLRGLGATSPLRPFAGIGFSAELDLPAAALVARVTELVGGRAPLHLAFGPEHVRSLAVVSGAGAPFLEQAVAEGHDAFLTGEPAERVYAQAREAGIHLIAAGHHATETFGVHALGERLARVYGIEHVFLREDNPI